MSFFNTVSGATPPSAAASENTNRTMVAVARNGISVVSNGASSFGDGIDSSDGDMVGEASIGFVAVLIVGIVLFYVWTRNVQGGG